MPIRFPRHGYLQGISKRGIRIGAQKAVIAREKNDYEFSVYFHKQKLVSLEIIPQLSITNHNHKKRLTLRVQFVGHTDFAKQNNFTKKGTARALTQFVINEARLSGIERIEAFVDEENSDAKKLFEKLGFTNAGAIGGGRRTGESETLIFFKELEPVTADERKERTKISIARAKAFKKNVQGQKEKNKKILVQESLFDARTIGEPLPKIRGIDLRNAVIVREFSLSEKKHSGHGNRIVAYRIYRLTDNRIITYNYTDQKIVRIDKPQSSS